MLRAGMRSRGFTMIELMIVVAIVGLLSAIAIPRFVRFGARARQAEAKANLKAVFVAARARFAERDEYGDPAANMIGQIGFKPERQNRYAYYYGNAVWTSHPTAEDGSGGTAFACNGGAASVVAAPLTVPQNFTALACSDIDGDPFVDTWTINSQNILFNGTLAADADTRPAAEDGNDVAL